MVKLNLTANVSANRFRWKGNKQTSCMVLQHEFLRLEPVSVLIEFRGSQSSRELYCTSEICENGKKRNMRIGAIQCTGIVGVTGSVVCHNLQKSIFPRFRGIQILPLGLNIWDNNQCFTKFIWSRGYFDICCRWKNTSEWYYGHVVRLKTRFSLSTYGISEGFPQCWVSTSWTERMRVMWPPNFVW